ncbi:hypothetical protein AJ85_07735 [Alkalihalobacillus alcalophilus ATCC 27647 = CGMCC 1.3604]|uniref:Core domain-containing protein n=1 Tax=Alkalihalobacillus alcalophilus ATCC 27647 = CGMCC 1.3604 TaxID=1218173 RepID=A0A094YT66_ALKAL|nr:iron-sulfur cluster biosynthesis family protein [Alkalihalobacillus alcalophilus]KGA96662.1 hypothetical protein BALCAV_0214905 [Alkalihalobacillus alcalophilus ATCC 27647 = CGMCC 1.3604]MED1561826.1 iron-sulfur cluster biosynthesis family protein [Alkalihalobacillus alcalophilus]THG90991.1 hypothetical protein AJ85_07735 [Alkalihalobacillus alcalophilus ATCC 27647 = CGMCC 1.3604]
MNITLTESAARLYIKEMELKKGDNLRLFVRIGGVGSGGFSVGVMRDTPSERAYVIKIDQVTFFVEEDDFWYLNGMSIDYNEDLGYLQIEHPTFDNIDHPEDKKES